MSISDRSESLHLVVAVAPGLFLSAVRSADLSFGRSYLLAQSIRPWWRHTGVKASNPLAMVIPPA